MEFWILITAFALGWMSALTGVALGGFLVYRTKRDPYDPLFSGYGKGEAFNLGGDDDYIGSESPRVPEATEANNDRFVSQFAKDLADKVGGV